MRIVFINLHCNSLIVKGFLHHFTGRSFSPKHRYFLEYLLKNNYKVASFIGKEANIVNQFLGTRFTWPFSNFRKLEHKKVMKMNSIDLKMIQVLTNPGEIKNDDIIIVYSAFKNQLYTATNLKGHKIVSLIHFFGDKETSALVQKVNPEAMMAEANHSKYSEIFKANYKWFEGKFIIQPFTYQQRFKSCSDFKSRKNKAVAIGTVTFPEIKDFVEFYGDNCYQPLRRQMLESKEDLKDVLDCYIYKYAEEIQPKQIRPNDLKIIKFYKIMYNQFHIGQQKSYFSFNMVEKFNEYKICIVPEDIHGMPGIGFVEGMACGCAYIGLDYDGYKDLGLIPGVHFIGYDGTLEDLRRKIEYYQLEENQEELERIALTGYRFVRERFNADSASQRLIEQFEKNIIGG